MYYSGLTLDRVSDKRANPDWIAEMLAATQTRVIPMWRDLCLVRAGSPVALAADRAQQVLSTASEPILLGVDRASAVFAADLSVLDRDRALEVAGADDAADVRRLAGTLTPDEAGTLAYARGISHWNRNQQFCGACGGRTDGRDSGHLRVCVDCGKLLFPRIEPAVIVLVELPGTPTRCLLGRHRGSGPDHYSTLAGFVEIGENLEDAVRREVAEETGVTVGPVAYQGSQAWPFPAGLMLGFRGEATSDAISVDGAEVIAARWFSVAEVRARMADQNDPFRMDSIGKHLIENWLADHK